MNIRQLRWEYPTFNIAPATGFWVTCRFCGSTSLLKTDWQIAEWVKGHRAHHCHATDDGSTIPPSPSLDIVVGPDAAA